jgi:transcriptional regulator with XRE-family HTH domain
MTLGANLTKYRKDKKMSQREVAEKVGIHPISYYRYEKDKLLPTADVLKRLSLALGVSLDDLFFTEEEKNTIRISNKELLERLDKIDQLSKKDRDSLIHLLDAFLSKQELTKKTKR